MTLLVNSVCSFQSIVVGLNRSDYMVDQKEDGTSSLKQVEINTIAAAGFGVTDCLPVVHRYLRMFSLVVKLSLTKLMVC